MLISMNKLNLIYLTSITSLFFILMASSSIYTQWLSMEFSTIILISMINIKSMNKIVSILYFMISSISSLLTIMIISFNFTQLIILKNPDINLMLMISMFMKIGMFPFCFWMIFIYNKSSWSQIFIISTFMKFIPIYFFSSIIYLSPIMITLLFLNNLFISLYTNLNFSIKKLFGCSSIFNSLLFILTIYSNKNLFLLFMIIYFTSFLNLILMMKFYNIENLNFNNIPLNSYYMLILMLFMYSSFPLFTTFMLKWEFIYTLNMNYSNNLIFLFLLSSMLMLWNYFILFKFMILKFKFNKLNKINFINLKKNSMIVLTTYSFMFMLFNLM
uniref:NADH-ubiquinone oxidoreductase chain 2 n=5 Tax=Bombus terrestris TaxID=30195 RepID=A0A0P0LXY2_BOMTE|nr:NADH dehydrogenase subunit 2 [Bombus terrestris lusitanicus]ALK48395.1 NADH dehydrogenase subunit 2 [Bombus terrestris]ALO64442.1 NADH dehydrogenase subunit 2 [Bombus terrestris]QFV14232.1 NADH dehydrogenase subunit 2 [Bombus terrestris lusitanicus]